MVQPLAAAISDACPINPKPVMSVQAWTRPGGAPTNTSAARRLSVVIEPTAAAIDCSVARSNLSAVAISPVPSRLVSSSASPAFAPAFASTRAGSTAPVTA